MIGDTDLAPEILDLRLGGRKALALAVIQIGPIIVRGVRVVERDGQLRVRLPGVTLEKPLFLEVLAAVLVEYRRVLEADPWADVRD